MNNEHPSNVLTQTENLLNSTIFFNSKVKLYIIVIDSFHLAKMNIFLLFNQRWYPVSQMLSVLHPSALLHQVTALVQSWPLQHCKQPWSRSMNLHAPVTQLLTFFPSGLAFPPATYCRHNIFYLRYQAPGGGFLEVSPENRQHWNMARSGIFWSFCS